MGADRWAAPLGIPVLTTEWARSHDDTDPVSVRDWAAVLDSAPVSVRLGLLFGLAAAGHANLFDASRTRWGVGLDALNAAVLKRASVPHRPVREWTWTGWLAFHAFSGPLSLPSRLLRESLQGLGAAANDLPPLERVWLNALVRSQQEERKISSARSVWHLNQDLVQPKPMAPIAPEATLQWALGTDRIPLDEGGPVRYRAVRDWLSEGAATDLESASPAAGTWRWAERWLMEEADGEERMSKERYERIRCAVLKVALKEKPAGPHDLRSGSVWIAILSSLEHAGLENGRLPSLGSGSGMHLPGTFEPWLSSPIAEGVWAPATQAQIHALAARVRTDEIQRNYGAAHGPSTWLGTWALARPRLEKQRLGLCLEPASEPRRRLRI